MTDRKNAATILLAGATAVALYASYLLFRPYATPILFACVVAIVFYPLHRKALRVFRRPNLSAAISTILTLLLSVAPVAFALTAISQELAGLYQTLAAKNAAAGGIAASLLRGAETAIGWVARYFSLPSLDLYQVLLSRVEGLSAALVRFGAALVTNAFSFLANSVIAFVILFFLFRDGESALARAMAALPFPQERLAELRARIGATVVANFYGGVAIGALQGLLTGLIFWTLGLGSPVLWGVVTGFFSLLPVVGSAMVWVPASAVLFLTGHWIKAVVLLAFGAAVIGTVDNIVRPLVLRRSAHLHTVFVFFALLGGLQLFGVLGLFVGPVVLSVTAALLALLKDDLAGRNQPSREGAKAKS